MAALFTNGMWYDGDVYRADHYTGNGLGWEAMPDDVLRQLDDSTLRQMFRAIMGPAYDCVTSSTEDCTADIPPYDHERQ